MSNAKPPLLPLLEGSCAWTASSGPSSLLLPSCVVVVISEAVLLPANLTQQKLRSRQLRRGPCILRVQRL